MQKLKWKKSEYRVILSYCFWFSPNCFKLCLISFKKLTEGWRENLQPVLSRHYLLCIVWVFFNMFFSYQTNLVILLMLFFVCRNPKTCTCLWNLKYSTGLWEDGIYWGKNMTAFVFFQCMLEKVGNWNFDIFLFDRLTNGESTSATSFVFYLLA